MSPTEHQGITRRRDLLLAGTDDNGIRALHRNALHTVRPGAYVDAADWGARTGVERHRLLVHATVPALEPGAVVSHLSAAVLHGFPVLASPPALVHVTRDRTAGGFRRHHLHSHVGQLPPSDVAVVGGLLVTSAARTVLDCARTLPFEQGVCIADDAVHRKLTDRDELDRMIRVTGPQRGVVRARQVVARADGGSESPGESLSRLYLVDAGLPVPMLQWEVVVAGRFVARTDFAWPGHRTLGEFDGAVKYGELAPTDDALRAVLLREKRREQELRDLGWEVVRWTWPDLRHPARLAERVRSAFRRAERLSA